MSYTPPAAGAAAVQLFWCVSQAGLGFPWFSACLWHCCLSGGPAACPELFQWEWAGSCSGEIRASLAEQTQGSHLLHSELRASTELETRAEELKELEPWSASIIALGL